MISYTTLGTNDLQRSARFYDEFFSGLGAQRTYEDLDGNKIALVRM